MTANQIESSNGSGTFNFNGGTVLAGPSPSADFITSGLAMLNVRNGGAFVNTNGANLTVAAPLTHSGVFGDAATDGGLTKQGAGTLTLSALNGYRGPTNVSAGTLAVTGAGGIANTRGITVNGSVSLAAGATLFLELGGTTPGVGGYDQVAIGGTLGVLNSNLSAQAVGGFTLAAGQTFFVLDRTGTDLTPAGVFANAPAGIYTDAAGDRFAVNYLARNPADNDLLLNDVSQTVLPVPEPGAWALLTTGGAALLGGLRRRATRRSARER